MCDHIRRARGVGISQGWGEGSIGLQGMQGCIYYTWKRHGVSIAPCGGEGREGKKPTSASLKLWSKVGVDGLVPRVFARSLLSFSSHRAPEERELQLSIGI